LRKLANLCWWPCSAAAGTDFHGVSLKQSDGVFGFYSERNQKDVSWGAGAFRFLVVCRRLDLQAACLNLWSKKFVKEKNTAIPQEWIGSESKSGLVLS